MFLIFRESILASVVYISVVAASTTTAHTKQHWCEFRVQETATNQDIQGL